MTNHTPITGKELQEMKLRCEKATPGVWVCEPSSTRQGTRYQHVRAGPKGIANTYHSDRIVSQATDLALGGDGDGFIEARHGNGEDALFIAHARQDLPRCLAEIERLQEELARCRGGLTPEDVTPNFSVSGLKPHKFECTHPEDCSC